MGLKKERGRDLSSLIRGLLTRYLKELRKHRDVSGDSVFQAVEPCVQWVNDKEWLRGKAREGQETKPSFRSLAFTGRWKPLEG